MDIRTAMYKAADSIEMNPDLFNYGSCGRPDPSCGTPGCALGWIGFHSGVKFIEDGKRNGRFVKGLDDVADLVVPDRDACTFYDRMTSFDYSWMRSAKKCAKALRLYADKYFPAEHKGIPQSVLDLFKEKVAVSP